MVEYEYTTRIGLEAARSSVLLPETFENVKTYMQIQHL
jgi:hypothetical protein